MNRILIQPEWDQILNEKSTESVWVQYKSSTEQALNGFFFFFHKDSTYTRHLHSSKDKSSLFNLKKISHENKSVEIVFTPSEYENPVVRKFVAPIKSFGLHWNKNETKLKPVTNIDVTNGGLGISCSYDGSLLIWLAETGQIRRYLNGHIGDVNFCRFFPSGMVVLSGAADLRMKVWSVEDGSSPVTLTGHNYGVSDAVIVERGRNIVSVGRDGQCKLYDVGEAKCLATVAKYDCIINACSIVSIEDQRLMDKLNIPPREDEINEREVLTDNKLIACACENGYLRVICLRARKLIFEYNCETSVNCCCFLNQTTVACGTQNGYIFIFDLLDKTTNSWREFRSSILSMKRIDEMDGFIATTGDGSCFTWSFSSTRSTIDLTGPNCDPVYNVAFNRTHIFTCCRDGYIRKYSMEHLNND